MFKIIFSKKRRKQHGAFVVSITALYFFILILFTVVLYASYQHVVVHDVFNHDNQVIEIIDERMTSPFRQVDEDPFRDDGTVSILLVGLDSRVGQVAPHCDAIQFFEIDRENQEVDITAVPRGTYSPLPFGMGVTTSDYYVSNACGKGGLDYGIKQIERILGAKADYLVFVGFSEAFGVLRTLKLPTTETLQWLRHRQGYGIGEPQRARNHSTFLKSNLIKFMPTEKKKRDSLLHYVIYNTIKTDLSFYQTQEIIDELMQMDLKNNPDRVSLGMKPSHVGVRDIPFDPDNIDAHLEETLGRMKHLLSYDSYSDSDEDQTQETLIALIEGKMAQPKFITWAYENHVWLQIEDEDKREEIHFNILEKYVDTIEDPFEQEEILVNYILEMQYWGNEKWEDRGRDLLDTAPFKGQEVADEEETE